MRKTSIYSAQDHVVLVIETDEVNDEGSCVSGDVKGQYSNSGGVLVDGTFEYFSGASGSAVPDTHLFSANAPGFVTHTDSTGKSLGASSISSYCLNFAIFPKDETTLRLWEGQFGKSVIDSVLNSSRDNVSCFSVTTLIRKRNPTTFEDITEEEDINITDIIYE